MVISAARISKGWLAMDFWNGPAVPPNDPRTLTGTPSAATPLFTPSVACDKDTPGAGAKLMVVSGAPASWVTDSGVLVSSTRAKADSGTCAPLLLVKRSCSSDSGDCWYSGASSITTRYWLSGL